MLIAIAVILVVAAIAMGVYVSTTDDTRRVLTETRIRQLDVACKAYRDATGAYPPDGQLEACLTKERTVSIGDGLRSTRPALLPDAAVLDGWGRPIRYKSPGVKIVTHVDLWSAGSNGVDGDVDDVHNWKG
jgi:general secretion pathway protein G